MSRLIKGLYLEAPYHPHMLFDLRNNQDRSPLITVIRGAVWYNGDSELLGWGDMAPFDYTEIAEGLVPGEMFIILPPRPGPFVQGIDHVAENARYVIKRGAIYIVPVETTCVNGELYDHPQLGEISVMSREHLLDLLTSPVPAS